MADEGFKRKPTEILSADVEGCSCLIGGDEEATIRTLKSCHSEAVERIRPWKRLPRSEPRLLDSKLTCGQFF
jgi:hypothetical protein